MSAYVIRDWKTRIKGAPEGEIHEIALFLEDVRLQICEQQGATVFFGRLQELAIGPIRSLVSGSCSDGTLGDVIPPFFDGVPTSSWLGGFENLSDTLN